jgi:antitoxin component YwqK of YwqJK toxin-antitoxin module
MRVNRLALIPVLIAAMLFLVGCRHTEVSYWPNGRIKSEIRYLGRKMHGTSTWWYETGLRQMEVNWRADRLEGVSTRWYPNGNAESVTAYSDGIRNGLSRTWDENGNRVSEEYYRNDTLHGTYTVWHPNGQIRISGFFDRGLFDSIWMYYDDRGLKIGVGRFDSGTGIQQEFEITGKLRHETPYRNNLKHGQERWFDANGNVTRIALYDNGQFIEEMAVE